MLEGQMKIVPDNNVTIRAPHPFAPGNYVLVQPHRDLAVTGALVLAAGIDRGFEMMTGDDPARQAMYASLGVGQADYEAAAVKLGNALKARMTYRDDGTNVTPDIPLQEAGFDTVHPAVKDTLLAGLGYALLAMVWESYGDVNTVTQANYPTRWEDFVAKCISMTHRVDKPVEEVATDE